MPFRNKTIPLKCLMTYFICHVFPFLTNSMSFFNANQKHIIIKIIIINRLRESEKNDLKIKTVSI